MNTNPYMACLVISLATAAISMTLSKAKVFLGLRTWLKEVWPWLGELLSCPYCTSHWVSLVLVLTYHPVLLPGAWWLNLFVVTFANVALAAFWSGLIFRAFKGTEA